ncbi:MAG: transporter large permease [Frankiales bacterium]|nr:transporter large permease [Frankiales bacterium]
MTPELMGTVGILGMLLLLVLRVPVALALMAAALLGYGWIVNPDAALARFGQDAFREGANSALIIVPMFVLMGMVLANAGLGADVFRTLDRFMWRLRGGLAIATVGASAIFGAVNGSAIAGATTMSLVAVPEMRATGYQRGFSGGVTAAGSTLGMLIPPSSLLVLYGLITEVPIGDVLIAAVVPGLIVTVALMATAYALVRRNPELAPRIAQKPEISKRLALLQVWPVPVIFGISMGGLYAGYFAASEAGAVGAFLALAYGVLSRRLNWSTFAGALSRTVRISAMVFLLVISGKMFGYFLAVSHLPATLGKWAGDLDMAPIVILLLLFLIYFVLGALMDETAILVIMTPIALPIILALGYDPVWFGVVSIMMLLTGLIMPPVGVLVFVVAGVTKIPLTEIYRGIFPFAAAQSACVLLVFLVPSLATFALQFMGD